MIDAGTIARANAYMDALYAMENTDFTSDKEGRVLVNGQALFKLPDVDEAAKLVEELKQAVGPVVGAHIRANRDMLLKLLSDA